MLRSIPLKRDDVQIRVLWIVSFTVLTIISAKISFETGTPVPFTMQVFATLLSGMVLGWRDGALSQLAYIGLIATGLPFDTRGLGTAAFFGPTGGYLIGLVAAAAVTGFLVEHARNRLWQRWFAGMAGVAVIYLFGASHLMLYSGMDAGKAWAGGVAPFLVYDTVKALLAAALTESLRVTWQRQKRG